MSRAMDKILAERTKIERMYTTSEVAEMLHRSPKTVSNWISAGKITVITGRPVLIPESALKAFIAKRTKRAII